jgi:hypothetical protein
VVDNKTALLAGADGSAPRPYALLGGEDANHLRTGCPRSGAAWSLRCSDLSPTVSYCHILRNLGVGMELTGAMEVALANCIFAASSFFTAASGSKGAVCPPRMGLTGQILPN